MGSDPGPLNFRQKGLGMLPKKRSETLLGMVQGLGLWALSVWPSMSVYNTMPLFFLFSGKIDQLIGMILLGAMPRNQIFGRVQNLSSYTEAIWIGWELWLLLRKHDKAKTIFEGKDDRANTSHEEESYGAKGGTKIYRPAWGQMGNFEPRKQSWPLHFFLWIK